MWDERPLFASRIEAWANGPVIPDVYKTYRGCYQVQKAVKGDSAKLRKSEIETVDAILAAYGDKNSLWLSELTHREAPWRGARKGVAPGERSSNEITAAAMAEYYGGLV